jgi:hypothetical protein
MELVQFFSGGKGVDSKVQGHVAGSVRDHSSRILAARGENRTGLLILEDVHLKVGRAVACPMDPLSRLLEISFVG